MLCRLVWKAIWRFEYSLCQKIELTDFCQGHLATFGVEIVQTTLVH